MAYLATLEGDVLDESDLLDRLFDCNDQLGVMVYGPEMWARLKNFVANMASKAIAENRGKLGTWARQHYKSKNDVLDRCFGFNDGLGCALLGGEGWGHFVNGCKLAAPQLGYNFLKNLVIKPAQNAVSALLPKSASAGDLVKWATGYQGIEAAMNTAKDVTGYTEQQEAAAAAKAQEKYNRQLIEKQIEYQREAEQNQADREKELAIESAKAEAAATGAYKTARDTDPNYLRAQTNNIMIFGGIALAAVLLLGGRN